MNKQKILELLMRHEAGQCNEKETALLDQWLSTQFHKHPWNWENDRERQLIKQAMKRQIEQQLFMKKVKPLSSMKWMAAAILLIACAAAIGIYFFRHPTVSVEQFYSAQAVSPGSNVARLTLANGKTVWLDDVPTGTLYDEGGIAITKHPGGGIDYKVDQQLQDEEMKQGNNIISVPRGGQYQIVLPDGTKVWLNSATTLTYPVAFTGKERTVSLTGEAYFEVTKNKSMPFRVNTKGTSVLVTGTTFNVTAYPDETKVKTTLVSGRVEVAYGTDRILLDPGQQAVSSPDASIQIKNIDTDYAVAWINGDFLFEDQDIQTIMKDIARWYNVDVTFEGTIPSKKFGGTYTRSKGIGELLGHLESLGGMHFNYTERRVTVMK